MEVENQGPIYKGLINLMDRFDDPKGIKESLRERVIRAVHQENWLLRYVATPGQKVANWVYNISVIAGRASQSSRDTNSHNINFFGNQNNSTKLTIHLPSSEKTEKKEKEKKEEDSRAGFVAILGLTTLTFGSAYALFYSTSRLSEIRNAKKEVEELQQELEELSEEETKSPYFKEVEDCCNHLKTEFLVGTHSLKRQEAYYQLMTVATGLVALGVGALAYDKLYKKSLLAHRAMIATLLASAITSAYSLTLSTPSEKPLERLETNYQERRVKINELEQTRYDVVANIKNEITTHSFSEESINTYSDFTDYVPYHPYPNPIWAPSAPPR